MVLPELTEMEKLLLMAAAVHGLGSQIDITSANSAIVVLQAIQWAGLDNQEFRQQWNRDKPHSALDQVYLPLVRMTQQLCRDGSIRAAERPGPALFEGRGNWGVPGDPKHPPCDP